MAKDAFDTALSNQLTYDYLFSIEQILKTSDNFESTIESTGNSTLICVNMDINTALSEANLSDDELTVLYKHFYNREVLEDVAWRMDKAVGKVSELKQSLLRKIYKVLNGYDYDKVYQKPVKQKHTRKVRRKDKQKIYDKHISSLIKHYEEQFNECTGVAEIDNLFKDLYQNFIGDDLHRDIILDVYLAATCPDDTKRDWIDIRTMNRWRNYYEVEYIEEHLQKR